MKIGYSNLVIRYLRIQYPISNIYQTKNINFIKFIYLDGHLFFTIYTLFNEY